MLGVHQLIALMTVAIIAGVSDARSPQRIRGGKEAADGEFPYQVSIRLKGQHICGGAILDEDHIITAAHCVDGVKEPYTQLRVATGSTFSFGGQTHVVKSVIAHESYDTSEASSPDDIALIKLKSPLELGKKLNKVALPEKDAVGGVDAIATGWGLESSSQRWATSKLMKITLKTLGHEQCQKHFRNAKLMPHQICTFGGTGSGVCQGDSGGPLVHANKLIGIVSYGIPCGIGFPDVYTNVFHFRDWIKNTMAKM
ncbi:chymotrypsin-1-like [Venturia canescens]|uniref:chymotrypsin-1-like n=1 Tax=Venturia canescens TaxID=32260 RepID=UPI001C9CE899|nr:chymotrypsin-1-like [Venturia canescens]